MRDKKLFFIKNLLFAATPFLFFPASPLMSQDSAKPDSTEISPASQIITLNAEIDSLAAEGTHDARKISDFIEVVVANNATDYFNKADSLYFGSLQKINLSQDFDLIETEVLRTAPLLDPEVETEWLDLLEKKDGQLPGKIVDFWARRDPIPTTRINERLIEHWRGIASARKKFTLADDSVYGTDARGLVFVKYGTPGRRIQDKLGINQIEIMRWFDNFLLRQEIQRYNTVPEFELWIYGGLEEDQNSIFLFGRRGGHGRYALLPGIETFIPESAFRRSSSRTTQGVMPGLVLQLMFYSELRNLDPFFLDRFRKLETLWLNARASGEDSPNRDVALGLRNHYKNIDKDRVRFKYMETERTNTLDFVQPIYLNVKPFRYLGKENKPNSLLFVVSGELGPDRAFSENFFESTTKSRYKFRHVLIAYDENWNFVNRHVDYPDLDGTTTSVLEIDNSDSAAHYAVVAERIFMQARKTELATSDLPDTAQVVGLSSIFIDAPAPLEQNDIFEVSDVLVGTHLPEELSETLDYQLPFIPVDPVKGRKLSLFAEVYLFEKPQKKERRFRMELLMRRIRKDGKIDRKREELKRKMEFASPQNRLTLETELDVKKLRPGHYQLQVKFRDLNSKQEKIRTTKVYLAATDSETISQ